MKLPQMKSKPPGAKAKKILKQDKKYMSPSYTRPYPLVVERGKGMMVQDVDGNRYLDFAAGIAVTATGHCHPAVSRAIARQGKELIHIGGTDFYYELQSSLAEKLARIAPGKREKRVFFTNSGTESVEAALKLARWSTRRPRMISFQGSFHGRTMGSLSLTCSKGVHRNGFAPLLPQVTHVPYPDCRRGCENGTHERCGSEAVRYIEEEIFKREAPPEEVAAIIVEPIQGEGGYIVPPDDFLPALAKLCRKYDILLIADEIQSGMGRTGKMFACEHWGVEPDLLCLAKGIASGMPIGAMIAPAKLMSWPPGAHANTFGGNPVAAAAAIETIRLLEGGLIANAAKIGEYLVGRLREMQERHRWIGDVRGKGLMVGAEIVRNPETKERAPEEVEKILNACFEKGLVLLGCGMSSIRFSPPLIATKKDVDAALDIFEGVLRRL